MWSTQQQAMLNVMGYTLYTRPGAATRVATAEVSAAPVLSSSTDSTLFKAVMKAAQGKDISQLGIDMNALRSSPNAKRALWPQLRKLMKP
jgi:hypothetical protein